MEGAIIESACVIDAGSRDQTIEMGNIPISQIAREGQGEKKPFTIRLIDCELTNIKGHHSGAQHFQVTFDGVTDREFFQVEGDAKGVSLQLTDTEGNIAIPGKPLPSGNVQPGDIILNYDMQLVGNKQTLKVGEYHSTIRFKLDYY